MSEHDLSIKASMDLLNAGMFREALDLLVPLSASVDSRGIAQSYIGGALFHLNRPRAALRWLLRAISADPNNANTHLNIANTYTALGIYDKARHHYTTALRLNPFDELVLGNFGHYLQAIGKPTAADRILSGAIDKHPNSFLCNYNYALLLLGLNRAGESIPYLRKCLEAKPRMSHSNYLLGAALEGIRKFDEALYFLEIAVELSPDNHIYQYELGALYLTLSMPEKAISHLRIALEAEPDSITLALGYYLVLPPIPSSEQSLSHYVERCSTGIDKLKANHAMSKLTAHKIWPHLFYLAYSDINMQEWLEKYNSILEPFYLSKDIGSSPLCQTWHSHSGRRLRIAFISDYFYAHSNSRAFEGLIKNIDKSRFEVIIINGPGSSDDAIRKRICAYADRQLDLQHDKSSIQEILALDLDVLFYTDLGMSSYMTGLAINRLARTQITGWGLPHTSGIKNIDYYLSSDLAEPIDADEHYTETLIRLPSLPCCYLSEHLELIEVPREYFFLPPESPLFGCLQSLYKLPPVFDFALEEIAIRNPDAGFVFVENPSHLITQCFLERVRLTAPSFASQLIFLTIMGRSEFIAVSNCVDVLLDPFHYCSGITFFESSYTGTPTVTLEGRLMRSRLVAAAYRKIGILDAPIASTADEYIEIASSLIQDRNRLANLKAELRRKARSHLYDDMDYVRSIEDFLESLSV